MKFLPDKIIKTRTADGKTVISEIYSLEAYYNNGFLYTIFIFIVTGLLAPIISPILLLFYCSEADKKPFSLNVVGILVPLYLLIDLKKGWIITAFISLFYKEKELTNIVSLNIAMILSHASCMMASNFLLNITQGYKLRFTACIIGLAVVFYFITFITLNRASHFNLTYDSLADKTQPISTVEDSLSKPVETVTSTSPDNNKQFIYDSLKQSSATKSVSASITSIQSASFNLGLQSWAEANLNVSYFRNGDLIPEAKTDKEWQQFGENEQPAWCYLDNDPNNDKLYNWYAVNDGRGIAPEGWHIASDSEWLRLSSYLENKPEEINNTKFFSKVLGYREYNGEF